MTLDRCEHPAIHSHHTNVRPPGTASQSLTPASEVNVKMGRRRGYSSPEDDNNSLGNRETDETDETDETNETDIQAASD